MIGWRTYVQDEHGQDLPGHALHGGTIASIGEEHKTPGLGLGRECRGFYNRVSVVKACADGGESEITLVPVSAEPLRLVCWLPPAGARREPLRRTVWLVQATTPRREVDRLRELMWPWVAPETPA